jgi:asparagine synthase (glutamine-hydrolysing)
LVHRGPDEAAFYCKGGLGLGFRRLSIIDAQGSSQPLSNESSQIWLVCNGEIYNYRELRSDLLTRHYFRTKGDAETILHLYEENGTRFVDKLQGMFAIALWDSQTEQLILVVDRFGKKPLYYLLDTEKIVFASELKSLLQIPQSRLQLDYEALDEYLSCGYITAPRTIFKGICKLCPGQIVSVKRNGSVEFETYWQPIFAEPNQWDKRPPRDIRAELLNLLSEAVRLRLTSDVPVGAFLSGGVDSTAVVALMREHLGAPVKTFSVGFEDAHYDETPYAHLSANYYQSDHYSEIISPAALDLLPKLVRHFDEPFADSSMIPTYFVARLARQHVSVVLSGDGGDEVFAGYHQHLYARRQQYLRSIIPASLFPLSTQLASALPAASKIKPYLTNKPAQDWLSHGFFSAQQRSLLYQTETRQLLAGYESEQIKHNVFRHITHLDGVSQLQYHDLVRYLPGDILVKIDRASMLNSLEVRCPFLDHKFFEFVARIPVHHRVGLHAGKLILKQALGTLLPSFIHQRKKQGFSIPQGEWLRDKLNPLFYELVHITRLFDRDFIQQIANEHHLGLADHKDRLWALLCLELWMHEYAERLEL